MSTRDLPSTRFVGCWPERVRSFLAVLAVSCAATAAILSASSKSLTAAELNAEVTAHPPMQYRRIFAPADKMDTWPRDGEKFIPVEMRDFDAWIRAANAEGTGQNGTATIDAAKYTARLADDGSLQGKGRWTIVLRNDKPAFLPFGPLSLVLRNAHWQDSPGKPARLAPGDKAGMLRNDLASKCRIPAFSCSIGTFKPTHIPRTIKSTFHGLYPPRPPCASISNCRRTSSLASTAAWCSNRRGWYRTTKPKVQPLVVG